MSISDFKSSKEAIDSLTPREREVLRERFGTAKKVEKPPATRPPGNDDEGPAGNSAPTEAPPLSD